MPEAASPEVISRSRSVLSASVGLVVLAAKICCNAFVQRYSTAGVRLIAMCCVACTASPAAVATTLPEPTTPVAVDSNPQPVTPVRSVSPRPAVAIPQPPIDMVLTSRNGVSPPPRHPDGHQAPRDLRVESIAALGPRWEVACDAFAGEPCTLRGDFDGDGRIDEALKIRETTTKDAGIAVEWADGPVSVIVADCGIAVIDVDFDFVDGFDRPPLYELSWRYALPDLAFLEGWRVMPDLTGPHLGSDDPGRLPVPAALGDGIAFHGSVLFFDGDGWRLLALV